MKDCRTWWRKGVEIWRVTRGLEKILDLDENTLLSLCNENKDCLLEQLWAISEGLA